MRHSQATKVRTILLVTVPVVFFVNCLPRTYTRFMTKFSIGIHGIERYPGRVWYLSTTQGSEPTMKTMLYNFVKDEQGQDLIEYTLLLAFVCLASAALFISAGGSVGGIWNQANSRLTAANTAAAS